MANGNRKKAANTRNSSSTKVGEQINKIVPLEEAEYVQDISPLTISQLKEKYTADRTTLLQRIEQEKTQVSALEGAIAACEQILQTHVTNDKVEIDG